MGFIGVGPAIDDIDRSVAVNGKVHFVLNSPSELSENFG